VRVLVVDDSAFMRKAITQMLSGHDDIDVIGAGRNGREAVELARREKPDVITLDIEMPEMDGLTALRHIMRDCPTQVLMLSSLTTEGSHAALTALKIGAADFLAKDQSQISLSITNIEAELLTKVRALGRSKPRKRIFSTPAAATAEAAAAPNFRPGQFDMICIGSSTGGPPVLEAIAATLPATLKTPIIIAQHMPEVFSRSMADRLAQTCRLKVRHIEPNTPIESGTVYICPGNHHTHVRKVRLAHYDLQVSDEPRTALYRPSASVLIQTATEAAGSRVLAIILTGIGDDGLEGCRALKAKGGAIIAQSEESCVVYGMPKCVTEAGLPNACLPPRLIAEMLRKLGGAAAAACPPPKAALFHEGG